MIDSSAREAAWAALHRPKTDPAELAAIAGAHPEFAGAIAAHPNAYPALREWAAQQVGLGSAGGAAPAGAALSTPFGGVAVPASRPPSTARHRLGWLWIVVLAVVLCIEVFTVLIDVLIRNGFDLSFVWPVWEWIDLPLPALLIAVAAAVTAPRMWQRIVAPCVALLPVIAMMLCYRFASEAYFTLAFPSGLPLLYALALLALPVAYGIGRPVSAIAWLPLGVLAILSVAALTAPMPWTLAQVLRVVLLVAMVVLAEVLTHLTRRRAARLAQGRL